MTSMYCNQIESYLHHTIDFTLSVPVIPLILLVVASYMCWYWLKGRANRRHLLEDDDSPHCWICLGEGPNNLGQPLRRDCTCRGSGGYIHLSCLAGYAQQKARHITETEEDRDFIQAYDECQICLADYENDVAIDMADEFESMVENEYPHEQLIYLQALHFKLDTIILNWEERLPSTHEAKDVANKILSLISEIKASSGSLSLPQQVDYITATTYNSLGIISLMEGKSCSLQASVRYFAKCEEVCSALGVGGIDESSVSDSTNSRAISDEYVPFEE